MYQNLGSRKRGYKKDIWKYEGLILGIQSKSRIEKEGYKKDIWKYEGLILGIQSKLGLWNKKSRQVFE